MLFGVLKKCLFYRSIAKSSTQKKEMLKNIKSTKPKQEEVIKNVTQEESLAVVPLSAENSSMSNTSNPKIWNGTAINSNNQISGKYTEKLVLASASPASTEGMFFTLTIQTKNFNWIFISFTIKKKLLLKTFV